MLEEWKNENTHHSNIPSSVDEKHYDKGSFS